MTRPAHHKPLEVHGYVGCPFAWRVRLAAAEKDVRFDWLPSDTEAPDPRVAEHNPEDHSPLIYDDGFVLLESEIIVGYIDEAFEGRALWPAEPRERAELRLLSTRFKSLDVHTEPSKPAARRASEPGLRLFEAVLDGRRFVHGDEPGAVDVVWWPFLANLYLRGLIDPARHKAVATYVGRFAARPSVRATRPPWAEALG